MGIKLSISDKAIKIILTAIVFGLTGRVVKLEMVKRELQSEIEWKDKVLKKSCWCPVNDAKLRP